MSIMVDWDNPERTILRFVYHGKWTLDEFHASCNRSDAMMAEVDYKVHIILDMRHSNLLPEGFIRVLRGMPKRSHPNTGTIVLVGANLFIRTFTNAVSNLLARQTTVPFLLTETLDEARAVLASGQSGTHPGLNVRSAPNSELYERL